MRLCKHGKSPLLLKCNFLVRGSVGVRHKSRAYLCVKGNSIAYIFLACVLIIPCIPTGIPTTHLFPDFTCSRLLLMLTMVTQVELSVRCLVKGYHECPFKVNIGETFYTFKKRRTWECIQSCQCLKKVEINS